MSETLEEKMPNLFTQKVRGIFVGCLVGWVVGWLVYGASEIFCIKDINSKSFFSNYTEYLFGLFWFHGISTILVLGRPCGVIVKAMDCGIVVREFVLQSRYHAHFSGKIPLGKV